MFCKVSYLVDVRGVWQQGGVEAGGAGVYKARPQDWPQYVWLQHGLQYGRLGWTLEI